MEVVAGIDIGGTNTVFALIDKRGKIVDKGKIKTGDFDLPEELVVKVCDWIRNFLLPNMKLVGIGIGAPNGNHFRGTIEFAPNLKWQGVVYLETLFRKEYDVPVSISNDANASAMGEMLFGAATEMKDFIQITLGTGVGSGIVIDGKIVYGTDSFAGEIGHIMIKEKGRKCGCGRRGCLETYASATGFVRTAHKLLNKSQKDSKMRGEADLTAFKIYEFAKNGDSIALEVFNYTAKKLGFALANAVAFSSPEAIFLFGGLAQSGNLLLEPTKNYMEKYLLKIYKNNVKLLPSGLEGGQAALLGSAALAWNKISSNE